MYYVGGRWLYLHIIMRLYGFACVIRRTFIILSHIKQASRITCRRSLNNFVSENVTCGRCSIWFWSLYENCALLGYYAASSGNSLPKFRDNLSVPSPLFKSTKEGL